VADRLDVVEPFVIELPAELQGKGLALVDLQVALARCDVIVVLVDHELFKSVDRALLRGKRIYDTRGLWRDLA
jgi:UDP-N-acetyl-D-mannosaminuronic acid dehydrogenase